MIVRVGIDLVSVDRIRKAMERSGFVERVLKKVELREPLTEEYVAGRWAAKEAVVKCLGGVISDYTIVKDDVGSPILIEGVPDGHLVHLSISHEKDHAVAVAVLEKRDARTPGS